VHSRTIVRYCLAAIGVGAGVAILLAAGARVNLTTAALSFVVIVMICAVRWGSGPALLAAIESLLAFNYFFIPPVHTFSIRDPENWIAFAIFVITALVVGQLSSRAQKKALEAEVRRLETERLYEQLKAAFQEASEAESLRRSERLKTALLDAVTHDLRTPLTAIKGSVSTLLCSPEPLDEEGKQELLLVIDEETDRLNHFVEEMMELAQIETGHRSWHRSPTAAHDIVNTAIDRASVALDDRPVEITIAEHLPLLRVDAASVSGVVYELLENASHYSPAHAPIHVTARPGGGAFVEIEVADRGAGIAPELRERVFEKFFRAPAERRDHHGFGLGLSIARGIIEAHGGKIWITGAAGGGTAVRFTVPCEEAMSAGDAG
jgi:K+-sensing histidine kinase KdpD